MENEQEIQNLLRMVIEARTKTQQIEHDIEQARKTQAAIKEANDERIRKIQEESRQLDSELGSKEITLNKEKSEIDTQIWEARAKLLRRIILCKLKNLLKDLPGDSAPDYALSTIFKGRFAIVYDRVPTDNSRPQVCSSSTSSNTNATATTIIQRSSSFMLLMPLVNNAGRE
jgi:hypothetical protein